MARKKGDLPMRNMLILGRKPAHLLGYFTISLIGLAMLSLIKINLIKATSPERKLGIVICFMICCTLISIAFAKKQR